MLSLLQKTPGQVQIYININKYKVGVFFTNREFIAELEMQIIRFSERFS